MPVSATSSAVPGSGTGDGRLPAADPAWPGNPARQWHSGAHAVPASIETPALCGLPRQQRFEPRQHEQHVDAPRPASGQDAAATLAQQASSRPATARRVIALAFIAQAGVPGWRASRGLPLLVAAGPSSRNAASTSRTPPGTPAVPVKRVITPPIIDAVMRCITSAPAPVDHIMGTNPGMNLACSRFTAPCRMASARHSDTTGIEARSLALPGCCVESARKHGWFNSVIFGPHYARESTIDQFSHIRASLCR